MKLNGRGVRNCILKIQGLTRDPLINGTLGLHTKTDLFIVELFFFPYVLGFNDIMLGSCDCLMSFRCVFLQGRLEL